MSGHGEEDEVPVLYPPIPCAAFEQVNFYELFSHLGSQQDTHAGILGGLKESAYQINHIYGSLSKFCVPCILYCIFLKSQDGYATFFSPTHFLDWSLSGYLSTRMAPVVRSQIAIPPWESLDRVNREGRHL